MADDSSAIVLREHGGPETLRAEPVDIPAPGTGEVLLRQTAIGVNFHDVYVRSGLYKTLTLPGVPGIEAAGVVEAAGPGVNGLRPGDRVAYVDARYGAYASRRVIRADRLVRLPAGLDERTAAAVLLKGLTVAMLLRHVYRVRPGNRVLVHAAAGGVGRLLTQWASHIGAEVIGTVGSEAKAEVARADGAHHTIVYRSENVTERVREITGGRGVNVAYDSVGRDTFAGSLASLALRGHLVNFGQSSGPVEPFSVASLAAKSITLSRPIVFHYVEDPEELQAMARELFEAIEQGTVRPDAGREFDLRDAAGAHRALEARETVGSIVLRS